MDLMRPNLAPGFQPCFVLETLRRYAEAGLETAAYYHIRDCFVDPADFDWMSPGGRRFMAHGRSEDLGNVQLRLRPWDIRWIQIE